MIGTPGLSQRRSACDRCCGQKLRCLRERADPEGRCGRCAKAEAQCITSPIYNMRNVFAQDQEESLSATTTQGKRKRSGNASIPTPFPTTQIETTISPSTPAPSPLLFASSTASTIAPVDLSFIDAFATPVSATNGLPSNLKATKHQNWNWDTGDMPLDHLFSPNVEGNSALSDVFENAPLTYKSSIQHHYHRPLLVRNPRQVPERSLGAVLHYHHHVKSHQRYSSHLIDLI